MAYQVKEMFYTLQGEGAHSGRPAVFCRFSGCNLWSGLEKDRRDAVCSFCDTEFVGTDGPGGGRFDTAEAVAAEAISYWPVLLDRSASALRAFVVCTGGEPLLQLDGSLVSAFHAAGFELAVETNGTIAPPHGLDWLCVSPKAGTELVITKGDELKLVYPQRGAEPEDYAEFNFDHFFLQPMDGPDRERNTQLALRYCLQHPQWKLSLQTHKLVGLP